MKQESQALGLEQQLSLVTGLVDEVLASNGPGDLCRALVHSEKTPSSARGAAIFFLDSGSTLRLVAKYGVEVNGEGDLSAWDDSPLSECVREKRMVIGEKHGEEGKLAVICLPFMIGASPIGLVAIVVEQHQNLEEVKLLPQVVELVAKIGAYYLNTLDFGRHMANTGPININPDDLTPRQLIILGHIEEGLVNLEIAKLLMVSESTVRQETVRIYKALGVGNRQEAVKKAKAMGVMPKRVLVSKP